MWTIYDNGHISLNQSSHKLLSSNLREKTHRIRKCCTSIRQQFQSPLHWRLINKSKKKLRFRMEFGLANWATGLTMPFRTTSWSSVKTITKLGGGDFIPLMTLNWICNTDDNNTTAHKRIENDFIVFYRCTKKFCDLFRQNNLYDWLRTECESIKQLIEIDKKLKTKNKRCKPKTMIQQDKETDVREEWEKHSVEIRVWNVRTLITNSRFTCLWHNSIGEQNIYYFKMWSRFMQWCMMFRCLCQSHGN